MLSDPGNGKGIPSQLIDRHDGSARLVDRFQSSRAFVFDEHDQVLAVVFAMTDAVVPSDVDHCDVVRLGEFARLLGSVRVRPKNLLAIGKRDQTAFILKYDLALMCCLFGNGPMFVTVNNLLCLLGIDVRMVEESKHKFAGQNSPHGVGDPLFVCLLVFKPSFKFFLDPGGTTTALDIGIGCHRSPVGTDDSLESQFTSKPIFQHDSDPVSFLLDELREHIIRRHDRPGACIDSAFEWHKVPLDCLCGRFQGRARIDSLRRLGVSHKSLMTIVPTTRGSYSGKVFRTEQGRIFSELITLESLGDGLVH